MSTRASWKEDLGPFVAGALLLVILGTVWWQRLRYPFDLEWMEGGMLAHAWRLDRGLPLYVPPNPEFVPYVYPPGYPAVVAALGKVFGLSMTLGRVVSVASILAAAGAIGWGVLRAGGGRGIAWGSAMMFLGTYPMSGAFYDIVRADSLGMALLGWSIVVAREERRWAPTVSGLLLAAAFLVKQNEAAFGVPIALALLQRDWRAGAQFVGASVIPALVAIAALQWWSAGQFLVWMRDVPGSHPMAWSRAWADVPREWGAALPVAFGAVGLGWVIAAMRGQRLFSGALVAVVSVWAGMLAVFWGLREPPAFAGEHTFVTAFGFWGSVTAPVAATWLAVGAGGAALVNAVSRDRRPWSEVLPPWSFGLEVGVVLTAGFTCLFMRVHESGFVNVHTPLFWCLSWATGALLARDLRPLDAAPSGGFTRSSASRPAEFESSSASRPAEFSQSSASRPAEFSQSSASRPAEFESALARWVRVAIPAGLTLQLLWASSQVDRRGLVPTAEDVAAGWQFVREIEKVDGPVLSPWAAWLPVYAGKPPSLHAMGVWDCAFEGGPYYEQLGDIERALQDHHWSLILGSNQPMLGEFVRFYDPVKEVVAGNDPALNPKTGYIIRPWRTLAPKADPRNP